MRTSIYFGPIREQNSENGLIFLHSYDAKENIQVQKLDIKINTFLASNEIILFYHNQLQNINLQ